MADNPDLYKKPHRPAFNLIAPSTAPNVDNRRRYNETRDVAYFFPHLMYSVVENLSNYDTDESLRTYMQATGVTPDDLLVVIHKFCDFVREVVNGGSQLSRSAFETALKVGLENTNVFARYLLMARIGQALVALFHDGYMDAFASGARPTLTEFEVKSLIDRTFKRERERIVINTNTPEAVA